MVSYHTLLALQATSGSHYLFGTISSNTENYLGCVTCGMHYPLFKLLQWLQKDPKISKQCTGGKKKKTLTIPLKLHIIKVAKIEESLQLHITMYCQSSAT
jgi:hypothetical protein